jgi:hypothetical protein
LKQAVTILIVFLFWGVSNMPSEACSLCQSNGWKLRGQ